MVISFITIFLLTGLLQSHLCQQRFYIKIVFLGFVHLFPIFVIYQFLEISTFLKASSAGSYSLLKYVSGANDRAVHFNVCQLLTDVIARTTKLC